MLKIGEGESRFCRIQRNPTADTLDSTHFQRFLLQGYLLVLRALSLEQLSSSYHRSFSNLENCVTLLHLAITKFHLSRGLVKRRKQLVSISCRLMSAVWGDGEEEKGRKEKTRHPYSGLKLSFLIQFDKCVGVSSFKSYGRHRLMD